MDHTIALGRLRAMAKKRKDFEEEHFEGKSKDEVDPALFEKYSQMQAEFQAFGARCNADPELMDLVACWMVGVRSPQPVSEDLMAEVMQVPEGPARTQAIHDALLRQGGMAQAVVNSLKRNGYHIHSNELGLLGWRVGCRATEGASRRLCGLLHRQFHAAIKSEIIIVERWFADFTLLANGK